MKLLCINVPKIYIMLYFIIFTNSILSAGNQNLLLNERNIVIKDHRPYSFLQSREGEFLVDTTIFYGLSLYPQWHSSIVFDGVNYLVAWNDTGRGYGIFCTRVDQTGAVIDSGGILVSSTTDCNNPSSIAFDGVNFFLVWTDTRGDSADIYGARIGQSGNVLDPQGIPISTAVGSQRSPSITFDGTNYLVVWHDGRNGNWDIYGARVDQSGNVLDPEGMSISTDASTQGSPSIAFDGTNYLVVWHDGRNGNRDIYGTRVDQSGNVLDPQGIPISTATSTQGSPSIAFDGTNHLVVWQDFRNSVIYPNIYGARINQSGVVLEPSGILISGGCTFSPSVAFDGTNYFVVWYDYFANMWYDQKRIRGVRVNQTGEVLNPAINISFPGDYEWHHFPSVAFGDTTYFVVWTNHSYPIRGARVAQSGILIDTSSVIISMVVSNQQNPVGIFNNSNFLIVWEDNQAWQSDIYGIRLDETGISLDTMPFVVSMAAGRQCYLSGSCNETNAFIVWQDERGSSNDIYGARVDVNGNVLDTNGIAVSTATFRQEMPSIAFDGSNYLVVWQDERNAYVSSYDIYGTRVTESGVVLDLNGFSITNESGYQSNPSIAFDGSNYLLIWQDSRDGSYDIYGARVDQSGTVLDPQGIPISAEVGSQLYPSIAFDGINYFVVWQDGYTNSDIYGARVSQAGIVLDTQAIAISTAPGKQSNPTVAYDGIDYLVIWEDERTSYKDIYGAKVSTSGSVIGNYAVVLQAGKQVSPSLTRGVSDQILLTYSGWTDSILSHPAYAMRIWGKFYPFIGIKEDAHPTIHASQYLIQVYPNPVQRYCNITYSLYTDTWIELSLYDVTGRLVKEIVNAYQAAGKYQKVIDMNNLAQSVYFIRLETDKHSQTEKVIYLK